MATPKKYFSQILKNIKITPQTVIYDLGCGKADFLFAAEKFNPQELIGFELSPLHIWFIRIKAKILKSKVKVYCKDFLKADISKADIVYLFLTKPTTIQTWQKIRQEVKSGTTILSLGVEFPDVECQKIIDLEPRNKNSSKVYIYEQK